MIFASRSFEKIAGKHALDGRLRADGHEHGSFDVAMRGVKDAGARTGGGADGLKLETEHVFIVGGQLGRSSFLPVTAGRRAPLLSRLNPGAIPRRDSNGARTNACLCFTPLVVHDLLYGTGFSV